MGVGGAVESVALGAVFIGKHFILSRADCGVDAACSLEPDELKLLVVETERGGQGTVTNSRSMRKLESLKRRRSLYFKRNLKSGAKISRDDVVLIRPARGLAPSLISVITGRTLKQDVSVGDSVT